MNTTTHSPLRVGVIGLGPNWHNRYKAALLAESKRFTLRWLYDEALTRAAIEAKPLGCRAAEGLLEAMNEPDLDAVLLLDEQWYRLWPVEAACRLHKPLFCVPRLASDPENAEHLCDLLESAQSPAMFARLAAISPATVRLQHLMGSKSGPARLLFCQVAAGRHCLAEILDWCLSFVPAEPAEIRRSVVRSDDASASLDTVLLVFPDGRAVQINLVAHELPNSLEATILAENGTARLHWPDRLTWTLRGKTSRESWRSRLSVERRWLRRFHAVATGGNSTMTDWVKERRTLQVLRTLTARET